MFYQCSGVEILRGKGRDSCGSSERKDRCNHVGYGGVVFGVGKEKVLQTRVGQLYCVLYGVVNECLMQGRIDLYVLRECESRIAQR